MESSALYLRSKFEGPDAEPGELVRVTSTDSIALDSLLPALALVPQSYPSIRVDLKVSTQITTEIPFQVCSRGDQGVSNATAATRQSVAEEVDQVLPRDPSACVRMAQEHCWEYPPLWASPQEVHAL